MIAEPSFLERLSQMSILMLAVGGFVVAIVIGVLVALALGKKGRPDE